MYCKHCGREIDDNSSFCKYCGKPQDNKVQTPNGLIDFVTNRPVVTAYILWVIINVSCLSNGKKVGDYYNLLYPKFCLEEEYLSYDSNVLNLANYQITDFIVYAILIPLVIFLGYHYFKKVTSIKYRLLWALWFIFNIHWYRNGWGYEYPSDCFFPFTQDNDHIYYYAYDLLELVFYTMIIPIAYWGYLYYKDRKRETNGSRGLPPLRFFRNLKSKKKEI